MQTPINWLKEFVDIKLPVEDLAWKLTEAGLTVEKWEEKEGDTVLDPEVTPNRPDWMSIAGVAREIAAVTGVKFKEPKFKEPAQKSGNFPINIKNDFDLCPRYSGLVISGVTVKPSPEWLQKRIKQVGLRPINNLVDITNYVMWELGNPLHVFDADKIRGKQMVLTQAKGGEEFRSLDGINYSLPGGAIIIKDLGRVIDLCGIKGGDNSAVSGTTKNIFLHVPVYNPVNIRKTSQALGLRSDASAIFERGANPGGTLAALYRAAQLVLELAGGKVDSPVLDLSKISYVDKSLELSSEKLNRLLGIEVSSKTVLEIFSKLGLTAKEKKDGFIVSVPLRRGDLNIEEDLIEEVGRIYGYNRFPRTLPQGPTPTSPVAYKYDFETTQIIKKTLAGFGYSEAYTYSLVSETQLVSLDIKPGETLRIENPISKEFEYLRPTILGNLLEGLKLNLTNTPDVRLFELGTVYLGSTADKVRERKFLSAVRSGEVFFETKGDLEELFSQCGITTEFGSLDRERIDGNLLHPGRAAEITSGKHSLGVIGELNPAILSVIGIKSRAVYWNLDMDLLLPLISSLPAYRPIPKYPAITEDLSLFIPEEVSYADIAGSIRKTSGLVKNLTLIDSHEDSLTLRVVYQDIQKNLTNEEVKTVRDRIISELKSKLGVKVRG